MTGPERGFLLLTGYLGVPGRKPLTIAQLRKLAQSVQQVQPNKEDRELTAEDLMDLGCKENAAFHIEELLSQEKQLDDYLAAAKKCSCAAVTRVTPGYPRILMDRLGQESPGVLWCKGDVSLLEKPAICLVGSRELYSANREFAAAVGAMAARAGCVLVSGNARGADTEAQESCLSHGGCVISVVADALCKSPLRRNVLYISEEGFDLPFTAARALSRNRVIHALANMAFVAQCSLERGGTWKGTVQNLRNHWSPVCCFDDGSAASRALEGRGAVLIHLDQLRPELLPIL